MTYSQDIDSGETLIDFMTPLLRNRAYIFTISLLIQFILNFLWHAQPVSHFKSLLSRVVVFRLLIVYILSKIGFIHVLPTYVYLLIIYMFYSTITLYI